MSQALYPHWRNRSCYIFFIARSLWMLIDSISLNIPIYQICPSHTNKVGLVLSHSIHYDALSGWSLFTICFIFPSPYFWFGAITALRGVWGEIILIFPLGYPRQNIRFDFRLKWYPVHISSDLYSYPTPNLLFRNFSLSTRILTHPIPI